MGVLHKKGLSFSVHCGETELKWLNIIGFLTLSEYCYRKFLHSFIVQTRDGKREAYRERISGFTLLQEGESTQIESRCATPPASVTVRMQVVEPNYRSVYHYS